MPTQIIAPNKKRTNSHDVVHDAIIIGAGAAGLFCAWQLGKLGVSVLVLDHANKAGKKILMSGGGKCNFTNLSVEPENYISQNPHFCKSALSRYTNWAFISEVAERGIDYEERDLGKLFCANSAKDILAMLLDGCQNNGVRIQLNTRIDGIKKTQADEADAKKGAQYQLSTSKGELRCSQLIIAAGGLSIPTMGATGFGYEVATQFGHRLITRQAALVPFTFTDRVGELCKLLSGIAIEVTASNSQASNQYASFTEPMLFTHRGLSGPAMLQLSSYWQEGESISVNLLPKLEAANWLQAQKQAQSKVSLKNSLAKELPKRVAHSVTELLAPKHANAALIDISDKVLAEFGAQLNDWVLRPAGTEGYRTAEVTLGGVCVEDISSKTMQSKLSDGLYFIGEVLDVTGQLGGYNFQWAWASGFVCAESVAEHVDNGHANK